MIVNTEGVPVSTVSTPTVVVEAPGKRPYISTLSPEERSEHASKASKSRWAKEIDWDACTLEEGQLLIAEMRAELEKGSERINRRMSEVPVASTRCYNPSCPGDKQGNKPAILDIASGRFACSRTRLNKETGLPETAFACSAGCCQYMYAHFDPRG